MFNNLVLSVDHIREILDALIQKDKVLIFFGGVHGVGKTFFCENQFTNSEYYHVSASSLIKSYGLETDIDKKAKCIDENQTALVHQLRNIQEKYPKVLLDGHFCLINQDSKVTPVPVDTFRELSPDIIFLLQSQPHLILQQLEARDNKKWDCSFIESFQAQEESHASLVSKELGIPLYTILNPFDRCVTS